MIPGIGESPAGLQGRTLVRPQAVRRVAEAVAAGSAGVGSGSVRAELSDRNGQLVVSVVTPVDLGRAETRSQTLVQRGSAIAEDVTAELRTLTGRIVAEVLVHVTGVRQGPERRAW